MHRIRLWPLAALFLATAVQAETVACHVSYGGETRIITAQPVAVPYREPVVAIGSYFLFRLVFEAGTAIKTYVYADREEGPVLLHQATYAYPPRQHVTDGFSGRHFVYEPVRDGELEFWCRLN